jgi:regulatory protein
VLAYVQRYAAPREQTRRRWAQRIARSVAEHGGEAAPLHAALEAVLDLAERYRFVDDRAFAASRSRRALARGVAPARVRAQLSARGVAPEVASGAVADAGGPDAEVAAAAARAALAGREPADGEG